VIDTAMIIVAGAAAGAPIVAAALVSLASVREDRRCSLAAPPRRKLEAIARRIVGFHIDDGRPRRADPLPTELVRRRS
jgi:hypothetical protein